MFKVKEKETDKIFNVYSVNDDSYGNPRFLIYYGNQWVWKRANNFIPVDSANVKIT